MKYEELIEIERMMLANKRVGFFGIDYLDNKLSGILQGDLILIGARSGAGKSTLSQMIANHNSNNGVKVSLFSLEDFENDAYLSRLYFAYKCESSDFSIKQREFISGEFIINPDAMLRAKKTVDGFFKNINLISRQSDFTIDKLKDSMIKEAESGSKIIILDHLDYVDKDNPSDNDISHVSDLMKTIREIQDEYKTAVIAFSHLRKPMLQKQMPAVPSIDEFIGSSNKVKQSTAVVMFAPDDEYNAKSLETDKLSTWCCVRKMRAGGYDSRCARMFFNKNTGNYDKDYRVCSVNYTGSEVVEITYET